MYSLFDMAFSNRNTDYDNFNLNVLNKIVVLENEIAESLTDENLKKLKKLKFYIRSHADEFWINECEFYLNYGMLLGMELQNFKVNLEEM